MEINLEVRMGLPAILDTNKLEMRYGSGIGLFEPWKKGLRKNDISGDDLWKSLKIAYDIESEHLGASGLDSLWRPKIVTASGRISEKPNFLYFGDRGTYWQDEESQRMLKASKIRPDVTVLLPGMIGDEFNRTEGHHHLSGLPEVYETVMGENVYLLFKVNADDEEKIDDIMAVFAGPGDHVIFPPGYQHISINIGNDFFVMTDWVSTEANSDFKYIKKHNGAPYWLVRNHDGIRDLVRNPNYKEGNVPPVRIVKPAKEIPEFGLKKGVPMLNLVRDGKADKLSFLNDPSWDSVYERCFIHY